MEERIFHFVRDICLVMPIRTVIGMRTTMWEAFEYDCAWHVIGAIMLICTTG